jgi:hypothetical protein
VGPLVEEPARVHALPVLAAVVRAPEGATLSGLDEGVDALRIAGGDGHGDLADGRRGQAVTLDR